MTNTKGLPESITLADLVAKSGRGNETLTLRTIGDGNKGYYVRINATIENVATVLMVTVSDKPSRK